MNIKIAQAAINDLKEIARLFDAYRVFYKQESNLKLAKSFLQERFEKGQSIIFYAKDENENYVGFTQLYPIFSSVSAQRTWLLNDLYVSKNVRGLGVGTKLLNKAKRFAQESGAKGIALETEISNTGAQKLYEYLGYEKDVGHFNYFLTI